MTDVFVNLASTAARARGYESLRQIVLPHPMETRGEAEIVEIANRHFGEILRLLTTVA